MGDHLKKAHPGPPSLKLPARRAATFNGSVDATQDFLRRQRSIGRTPAAARPPASKSRAAPARP